MPSGGWSRVGVRFIGPTHLPLRRAGMGRLGALKVVLVAVVYMKLNLADATAANVLLA
jgi:hypothetical protein